MGLIRDERGVVIEWLLKLVVGLALVGVIVYDLGSLAVNFFTLDSKAEEIALEISTDMSAGGRMYSNPEVVEAARTMARRSGAHLVKAELDTTEKVLEVRLRRRADTVVLGLIGPLKKYMVATADGRSGTQ